MKNKFNNIEEAVAYVKSLDLYVVRDYCHDLGKEEYIPCVFIQSENDRSVGIFPVDFSPTFTSDERFIKWLNENHKLLKFTMEQWDETNEIPENILFYLTSYSVKD